MTYNLYNIKYMNDDYVNYPYDPTGSNPEYPYATRHMGVDLFFNYETLYSVTSGVAYYIIDPLNRNMGGITGYGNHVILDGDDGYIYMFAHLSTINIYNGQRVETGDILGITGNTGDSTDSHLHFEIRVGASISTSYGGTGTSIDPSVWRANILGISSGWKRNSHGTWYRKKKGTFKNGNQPIIRRVGSPFANKYTKSNGKLKAFKTFKYDEECLQDGLRWLGRTNKRTGKRIYLPISTWNGVAPPNQSYGYLWGKL